MHPTTTVKNKPECPHTVYVRNNSTTNYLHQRLSGEALFSLQTFWSFRTCSNIHHFCTLIMSHTVARSCKLYNGRERR